ncbi:unnamed protein product, partial [Rotaria sp. Silwood1]
MYVVIDIYWYNVLPNISAIGAAQYMLFNTKQSSEIAYQRLDGKEIQQLIEQRNLPEEFFQPIKMLEERSTKLIAAKNNKKLDNVVIAKALVIGDNDKLTVLKIELPE